MGKVWHSEFGLFLSTTNSENCSQGGIDNDGVTFIKDWRFGFKNKRHSGVLGET